MTRTSEEPAVCSCRAHRGCFTNVHVSVRVLRLLDSLKWNRIIQIGAAAYLAGAGIVAVACGKPKFQAAPPLPADSSDDAEHAPNGGEKRVASTSNMVRALLTDPHILLAYATSTLLNPFFMFSSVSLAQPSS